MTHNNRYYLDMIASNQSINDIKKDPHIKDFPTEEREEEADFSEEIENNFGYNLKQFSNSSC